MGIVECNANGTFDVEIKHDGELVLGKGIQTCHMRTREYGGKPRSKPKERRPSTSSETASAVSEDVGPFRNTPWGGGFGPGKFNMSNPKSEIDWQIYRGKTMPAPGQYGAPDLPRKEGVRFNEAFMMDRSDP